MTSLNNQRLFMFGVFTSFFMLSGCFSIKRVYRISFSNELEDSNSNIVATVIDFRRFAVHGQQKGRAYKSLYISNGIPIIVSFPSDQIVLTACSLESKHCWTGSSYRNSKPSNGVYSVVLSRNYDSLYRDSLIQMLRNINTGIPIEDKDDHECGVRSIDEFRQMIERALATLQEEGYAEEATP